MEGIIAKEYSTTLEILNKCDYLDPESSNAKDALLSCSGKNDHKNPMEERYCLNSNRPLIEGFAMDNNNMLLGPGVGYTPNFECEIGVKRNSDGSCALQEFSGRERDGNWQKGHDREIMHLFKDVFDPCKSNKYTISPGGYFICSSDEESSQEETIVEGFQTGPQYPDPNQSIVIIEENQAQKYNQLLR